MNFHMELLENSKSAIVFLMVPNEWFLVMSATAAIIFVQNFMLDKKTLLKSRMISARPNEPHHIESGRVSVMLALLLNNRRDKDIGVSRLQSNIWPNSGAQSRQQKSMKRKKGWVISMLMPQWSHLETTTQPLCCKFSSVRNFAWISL